MAKSPLFNNWIWKLSMPVPFDKTASNVSTAHCSTYNTMATRKATLHSPLLAAILAYMEMDTSLTPGSSSESAIGTQSDKTVTEYQSRTGEIHVAVFNKKNGKFNVGRYAQGYPPGYISRPEAGTNASSISSACFSRPPSGKP